MTDPIWNDDFTDMLRALLDAGVEFMLVGAHAMAAHGVPRATADLDIWIRATQANSGRVVKALEAFGAPLVTHGITEDDFCVEGTVYQLGLPPNRIDLLTSISGVSFDDAASDCSTVRIAGMDIPVLGLKPLIANKCATGREKDAVDVNLLKKKIR